MLVCCAGNLCDRGLGEWLDHTCFEISTGGPAQRWAMLLFVALWLSLFVGKVYRAPTLTLLEQQRQRQQPAGWLGRRLAWVGGNMLAPVRTPQPHLSLDSRAVRTFQHVLRS